MISPRSIPTLVALTASLAIHVLVILPALTAVMEPADPDDLHLAKFEQEPEIDTPAPAAPRDPEMTLGMDDGSPSSMTWIGYEEYQEHLAELADVEQAAFTRQVAGAVPAQESAPLTEPVEEPAEEPEPEPEQDAEPAEQPDEAAPSSIIEPVEEDPVEADPGLEVNDTEPTAPVQGDAPRVAEEPGAQLEREPVRNDFAEALADLIKRIGVSAQSPEVEPAERTPSGERESPERSESSADATEEAKVEPTDSPAETNKPAQPSTTPRKQTPPGVPETGDVSDRESTASSTVEVPLSELTPGKPISAKGLELRPARPKFTSLQIATVSPRNPLVEFHIKKDGTVKTARLVTTTGHPGVDRILLSSLYRWTASGKPLEALEKDQTLPPIRVQIILNRRRR